MTIRSSVNGTQAQLYLNWFERTNEQGWSGHTSTSVTPIFTDSLPSPEVLIPVNQIPDSQLVRRAYGRG